MDVSQSYYKSLIICINSFKLLIYIHILKWLIINQSAKGVDLYRFE